MAKFSVTAWTSGHPWGEGTDVIFDRLHAPVRSDEAASPSEGTALSLGVDVLVEPIRTACARACGRWGGSRVGVILGGAEWLPELVEDRLGAIRRLTGILGASYYRVDSELGVLRALASADRLLRASLLDAALVGGLGADRGALLLIERHGDAFVELAGVAEAVGAPATDGAWLDEAAAGRAVEAVWSPAERRPLGYVHIPSAGDPRRAQAHRRWLPTAIGPAPWGGLPAWVTGGSDVLDVPVLATALARGFTPQAPPRELEYDRVLLHACSAGGHHVAVRLEVRR